MQAIVRETYGSPDVLELRDIDMPDVGDDVVLVRVRAASLNQADLDYVLELVETGKLTPVIDRTYPLSEVKAALRYMDEGHARGKVIIAT